MHPAFSNLCADEPPHYLVAFEDVKVLSMMLLSLISKASLRIIPSKQRICSCFDGGALALILQIVLSKENGYHFLMSA
jgi:hypothetical protein